MQLCKEAFLASCVVAYSTVLELLSSGGPSAVQLVTCLEFVLQYRSMFFRCMRSHITSQHTTRFWVDVGDSEVVGERLNTGNAVLFCMVWYGMV